MRRDAYFPPERLFSPAWKTALSFLSRSSSHTLGIRARSKERYPATKIASHSLLILNSRDTVPARNKNARLQNRHLPKLVILFFVLCLLAQSAFAAGFIKMATTTSTENSGLLEYIIPDFENRFNIDVHVIAVGTGRAVKLGENGDVDLILIHDKTSEDSFIKNGFGVNKKDVMHNNFVIVGPLKDPAGIKDSGDAVTALKKIFRRREYFVSRGDESGTHKKEMSLWNEAGVKPEGRWYLETGQGMGASLKIAEEKRGYLLSDKATYLNYKDKIDLTILFDGDKRLFNPYSIIAVNPDRYPQIRYREAMLFIEWIISDDVQRKIGKYKKYNEVLFYVSTPRP